MGYTHYWTFNNKAGKASNLEARYQKAILECQKVVRAIAEDNRKEWGSSGLSGYTAHTKVGQYGGLEVNGKSSDACESFIMREHFSQNESFGFCKTGRRHYDFAVVACLAILQYRLGDAITVSSDGDISGWTEAVAYASKKLRRKIAVPSKIRSTYSSTLRAV
jgi:hypothetical protein